MRKQIIAGNWKMNKTLPEAISLAQELSNQIGQVKEVEIVVCPPAVNLSGVFETVKNSEIKVGGQNVYMQKSGAFTGELSVDMLKSVGCTYVIIGHSERREYFGETNQIVNQKVKFALENGITPIMCCGETLAQRESNQTFAVIKEQLEVGLANLKDLVSQNKLVIAYEPVWAIGTGKVATPEQAQEVHAFIRQNLEQLLGTDLGQRIQIQYGGSVNAENSASLLSQPDIDGALVGGASLKTDSFSQIVRAAISQYTAA